jgi:hypothetical protein
MKNKIEIHLIQIEMESRKLSKRKYMPKKFVRKAKIILSGEKELEFIFF